MSKIEISLTIACITLFVLQLYHQYKFSKIHHYLKLLELQFFKLEERVNKLSNDTAVQMNKRIALEQQVADIQNQQEADRVAILRLKRIMPVPPAPKTTEVRVQGQTYPKARRENAKEKRRRERKERFQ